MMRINIMGRDDNCHLTLIAFTHFTRQGSSHPPLVINFNLSRWNISHQRSEVNEDEK